MPEPPPETAQLKQVPFFAHLDERRLEELVTTGHRRAFAAGETVFEEGDEADGMYVVLTGRARLVRRDGGGREWPVAAFEPGSFFGELALLERRPRSATVVTVEAGEFFLVEQAEFMRCLSHTSPEVVVRVVAAISRMVRDATERLWRQQLASEKLHAETEIARHRAVGQMVAGVAHELNTPLGIASTAADMIETRCRQGPLADRVRGDPASEAIVADVLEASGLLRSNVLRAHRLVESFKQVSARQASEPAEPVDAAEVARDVLDLFRLSARRSHLSLRLHDRRHPSDRCWTGSPGQLTQLLLNLLTNVERHAYPDGNGGPVDVELGTAAVAGRAGLEVIVRDRGQGIPSAHRSRVFEPFFTTARGQGGTGLGLAIVHNLVTSLGGTIRVDSESGQGTSVTVALPSRAGEEAAMH